MAAKSTKGKKNTKSTAKKTQQKSGQSQNRDEIRGEIIILGLLAVCILLVLSNFGLGGIVGRTVSSVFFGISDLWHIFCRLSYSEQLHLGFPIREIPMLT